MASLPLALAEAVAAGRLVCFCGAGVSMGAPSYLPGWRSFNEAVLDEARSLAFAELPELDADTRRGLERLSLDDVPVVAFSETLVRTFAGATWFDVLGVLDADRVNASHIALAELAMRGGLRAIVSTNFDTLIERAFRERAVTLNVLANTADFRLDPGTTCTLYKIHGSAVDAASMVDTVSQKLRGLPLEVRTRLSALARDFHLLVLGYSGGDLDFGDDYLAVADELRCGPGLTWLLRPGDDVPDRVARLVATAGENGTIVRGQLPGFFAELGVRVEEGSPDDERAREHAKEGARRIVASWLKSPSIDPLVSGVYLARLLSLLGKMDDARSLRESIAVRLLRRTTLDASAQTVLHALALAALADDHLADAKACLLRELEIAQKLVAPSEGDEAQGAGAAEQERVMAEAWLRLAECERRAGNLDEGRALLLRALPVAHAAGELRLIALIQLEHAKLAKKDVGNLEVVLEHLEAARSSAKAAGDADTLLEIELAAAEAYTALAEYDAALDALDDAGEYAALVADYRGPLRRRARLVELALRRGRPDEFMRDLAEVIETATARGDRDLADEIRWRFCSLLGFYEPARERVLAELDTLLDDGASYLPRTQVQALEQEFGARSAAERTPAPIGGREALSSRFGDRTLLFELRSERRGVPSVKVVSDYREALVGGDSPILPPFVTLQGADDEREQLRRAIAAWEFAPADPELPFEGHELAAAFARFCEEHYEEGGSATRLRDLARAELKAAERSGTSEQRVDALNWLGIASDLAGDLDTAAETYLTALASDPPPTGAGGARTRHNLAVVLARAGRTDEALELFDAAVAAHVESGDGLEEMRAREQRAAALGRADRRDAALEEARAARRIGEELGHHAALSSIESLIARLEQGGSGLRPPAGAAPISTQGDADLDEEPLPRTPEALGNLALREWGAGRRESARVHCREAMAGYAARNDDGGISRCLNNLAEFSADEGDYASACDFAREALALRVAVADLRGQLLTLANLAALELASSRPQAAVQAASQALELARHRPDEPAAAGAALTLLRAYLELDDNLRIADAARTCLRFAVYGTSQELEQLTDVLRRLAHAPVSHAVSETKDEREAMLAEANRLGLLGDVDAVEVVVEDLLAQDLELVWRGYVEGIRGNALQNAGRDEDAIGAYELALTFFDEAGDANSWLTAASHLGVSLRRLGLYDASVRVLRVALARVPEGLETRTALANTLIEQAAAETGDEQTLLAEARELLAVVIDGPNVGEDRGIALVSMSNIDASEGDLRTALERRSEGLRELRRQNSRYVDAVAASVRELESLMADQGGPEDAFQGSGADS